jgi:uncharacterized protein
MKKILLSIGLLIVSCVVTYAHELPSKPVGYVNDFAGFIKSDQRVSLENKLSQFSASTSHEVVLVVVPDLDGIPIEQFATNLFEKWGIGTSKHDNGVLLLIALHERGIRIEVGYGLEGALPDILAKQIIEEEIRSRFTAGEYALGLENGVDAILQAVAGEYSASRSTTKTSIPSLEMMMLVLFAGIQFFASIFARSKSWWAGGVVGFVLGVIVTVCNFFDVSLICNVGITVALTLIGLFFDYVVSKTYTQAVSHGSTPPWWVGGGRGVSSFGGFGGGRSGGGGASGRW